MSDEELTTDMARDLLDEIERELRRLELWDGTPPAPAALESTAPFAFDTLEFNQWLQWIFLPRTHAMLDAGGRFPAACDVSPMAEWFVSENGIEGDRLIRLMQRFDAIWNSA